MYIKKFIAGVEAMPKGAYLLMRYCLIISCLALFGCLVLLIHLDGQPKFEYGIYMNAMALLEQVAGLLLSCEFLLIIILDFSK